MSRKPQLPLLALAVLALPASAQTIIDVPRLLAQIERHTTDPARARTLADLLPDDHEARPRTRFAFEADALDYLAARVRLESPPVDRDALDGISESAVPFHDAPGGIVLGLTAVTGEEWPGARVVYHGEPGGLVLLAADGTCYRLPHVEPWLLATSVSIVLNPRHTDELIDIDGSTVTLAPELAKTPLTWKLERADRAPRGCIPSTGAFKSLIVDRAVRFGVTPGATRIELRADLEIRLYEARDSWLLTNALHRAATWAFVDEGRGLEPLTALPRGTETDALLPCLEDVAELAGWLGFLRWAEENEPGCLERLRAELAAAPQAGKVSASQR